ncbi:TetR/AcrR family transcriptional regulator [Streptomyces sp. NPDC049916]|uniref:TetR/AcrR family transcriptional regulator n=1 Tax=Streptomyces sp. NPDC049916 TaxID=3155156 RepID=UPI003439E50A
MNGREPMLLEAANYLCRRPNAPITDIAAALGVSRATLHRHFAGRDELLHAVSGRATEQLHVAISTARLMEGSAVEALRRFVTCLEDRAPFLSFLHSLRHDDASALLPESWKESDAAIRGIFERGQRSREFTTALTAVWMTEVFYDLVAGAAWAVRNGRCAKRDFVASVTRTILLGTIEDEGAFTSSRSSVPGSISPRWAK